MYWIDKSLESENSDIWIKDKWIKSKDKIEWKSIKINLISAKIKWKKSKRKLWWIQCNDSIIWTIQNKKRNDNQRIIWKNDHNGKVN